MDNTTIFIIIGILCICCISSSGGAYFYTQSSSKEKPTEKPVDKPVEKSAENKVIQPAIPTTIPQITTLPPLSMDLVKIEAPMGQNNHSTIYFKNLTIQDNPQGGVDVWIDSPLTFNHNISQPGLWVGNITTTIDTNWNITVTYTSMDKWLSPGQWTYGWMKIETFLQGGTKITNYNTNYLGGTTQGEHYAMRPPHSSTDLKPISIIQNNNSKKLTFKSKDNLLKISANIVGYWSAGANGNFYKANDMDIHISDKLSYGSTNVGSNNYYSANIPI
jgi:hypothetical protein